MPLTYTYHSTTLRIIYRPDIRTDCDVNQLSAVQSFCLLYTQYLLLHGGAIIKVTRSVETLHRTNRTDRTNQP